MSQTEIGSDSFSDANMDGLLKEFFEHEMPADLRQATAAPRRVSDDTRMHRRDGRLTRWLGLSVVAGSLLTVTILLSQPSSQSPNDSAPEGPVAGSQESKPETDGTVVSENTNVDRQDSSDDEIFDRANGPVEWRIKNVLILDSDTGTGVEMLLPELEIEIFPIDDDDKDDGDARGDEARFRFQLQRKMEGTEQHLYLRVQWPIAGQGAMRNLELDLGTDVGTKLDIEQLLNSEPLKQELDQLPPEIRRQLESALRKAQFPASKVKQ
jgi:hypothetical protein